MNADSISAVLEAWKGNSKLCQIAATGVMAIVGRKQGNNEVTRQEVCQNAHILDPIVKHLGILPRSEHFLCHIRMPQAKRAQNSLKCMEIRRPDLSRSHFDRLCPTSLFSSYSATRLFLIHCRPRGARLFQAVLILANGS